MFVDVEDSVVIAMIPGSQDHPPYASNRLADPFCQSPEVRYSEAGCLVLAGFENRVSEARMVKEWDVSRRIWKVEVALDSYVVMRPLMDSVVLGGIAYWCIGVLVSGYTLEMFRKLEERGSRASRASLTHY